MARENEPQATQATPPSTSAQSTRRPAERRAAARPMAPEPEPPSRPRTMRGVLGEAEPWWHVFRELDRGVDVPCPILLTGPHGCGKHTCARALHRVSTPDGPFVFVDAPAGDAGLGELPQRTPRVSSSAAPAAHSGQCRVRRVAADADPEEWLALARSGTLFVSELTSLPPRAQLLLAETLGYGHQGSGFRLVVGSEHSGDTLRAHPAVRRDLFYRVSILSCAVPPLRQRGQDILLLARDFLRKARTRSGAPPDEDAPGFSAAAERLLLSHTWPGNMCELRNAVEHAAVVAKGPTIHPADLPSHLRRLSAAPEASAILPKEGIDLRAALDALENRLLQEALERTGWNKQRAARLLGLNRTTLVEMLKRKRLHRLTPPG